jgi:hypothetical protein
MGQLIVMPSSKTQAEDVQSAKAIPSQIATSTKKFNTDFSVWKDAPRERTAPYFPTYSAVSKAIQTSLRSWVIEWFVEHKEILQRPHQAYSLLVYQCTHPFSGRPTNMFTYEIQQTDALNRAFRSAANKLGRHLRKLDTKKLPWFTREHYFAYRSDGVVKYVVKNPRAIYRMLHVETMLMDAILRFSIMDLPTVGMEASLERLRRTFKTQLHRFSEEFDLSPRAEELLDIATEALVAKMAADAGDSLPEAA